MISNEQSQLLLLGLDLTPSFSAPLKAFAGAHAVQKHELSASTIRQLYEQVRLPFLSNERLASLTQVSRHGCTECVSRDKSAFRALQF